MKLKRVQVLELIKLAIADGDTQTATRLYCGNRISMAAFSEAMRKGEELKMKLNGRKTKDTLIANL